MISDHLALEPLFLRAQQAQRQALQARKRKLARQARAKPERDNSALERRRSTRQQAGDRYEEAAWHLVQQAGCELLGRQLSCPLGELDLVVREGTQLVFIEVRQRTSACFGGAAASVSRAKQQRFYVPLNGGYPRSCAVILSDRCQLIAWISLPLSPMARSGTAMRFAHLRINEIMQF